MNNNNPIQQGLESITATLYFLLTLLSPKNKERSGLGLLLGGMLLVSSDIFEPYLITISMVKLTGHEWYYYIIIGLFVIYFPVFIRYFFSTGKHSDKADAAFDLIKRAEKSGVSKKVIGDLYIIAAEIVLEKHVSKDQEEDTNKAVVQSHPTQTPNP